MASAILPIPTVPRAKLPEPDFLYEIVNGEMKEVPPMGRLENLFASVLGQILGAFAKQNKLGFVVVEMLFRIKPHLPSRRPDVAFVPYARVKDSDPLLDESQAWEVVPSLAVEVVSPTNSAVEILVKTDEYLLAGVESVWVAYPRQQRIYVYESPTKVVVLGTNDNLDGGRILPGFQMPLQELFEDLSKPA